MRDASVSVLCDVRGCEPLVGGVSSEGGFVAGRAAHSWRSPWRGSCWPATAAAVTPGGRREHWQKCYPTMTRRRSAGWLARTPAAGHATGLPAGPPLPAQALQSGCTAAMRFADGVSTWCCYGGAQRDEQRAVSTPRCDALGDQGLAPAWSLPAARAPGHRRRA